MTVRQEYAKLDYPKTLCYQSYDQITVDEEQIQAIDFILRTLESYSSALSSCLELKKKGQALKSLHPYKIVAIIITNEEYKKKFCSIFNMHSYNPLRYFFFKKCESIFYIPVWMQTLLQDEFLDGFAFEIKKDKSTLRESIQNENWENFFRELTK